MKLNVISIKFLEELHLMKIKRLNSVILSLDICQ
jgi:hypothetical protein